MGNDESLDDIEAAYRRAMQIVDVTESAIAAESSLEPPRSDSRSVAAGVAPSSDPEAVDNVAGDREAPVLHPREVIEAALFVGGQSLTTKRLCRMLGGDQTSEQIDTYIDELNEAYRQESRPYQIDFGEGGYRLVLLSEFESVRRAVFGTGPNEIKLSQDALEVLAFVAYRQPAGAQDVEEAGQKNAPAILRQLLRRQLVALQRTDDGDVTYSTTPRFLELFGLRSLDDLPFPEDFELK